MTMNNSLKILIALLLFLMNNRVEAQLSMPPLFSDNMVLQREVPINIWGKAKPGQKVSVKLATAEAESIAAMDGTWKVTMPPQKVGKPLDLVVASGKNKLEFSNILIGEVWVCSGQSNMRWYLQQSTKGKEAIANADLPELRLFNMNSDIHPGSGAFNQDQLDRLKNKEYYQTEGWKVSSAESAENFSAVAYYFGKKLLDSLKVPIGLIHNAIGGSTTDSWIDETILKKEADLRFLVDGSWPDVKGINPWVRSRSKENLLSWVAEHPELLKNHPFAPGYLFQTGIKPLLSFSMRGVIWYQGESNATHPELHNKLFPLMIKNWRNAWKQGDFPFLFVQLPNIANRNRWPEFRDGQQKMTTIPNTGMAVIIDSGTPENVHPTNKTVVGNRLALLALDDVYGFDLESRGPSYTDHEIEGDLLTIHFSNALGLKTNNGQPPMGFVIQGYDANGQNEAIIKAELVKIVENAIHVVLPDSISPTKIKYAWAPNPEVNLYNEAGLPMVPFKIELPGNN